MATITSAASGNWTSGATWVGGVPPRSGYDRFVIASPHTVTYNIAGSTTKGACTISIATPGVITYAGHGFVAGDTFQVTTTGALPTGMREGLLYFVSATGLTANTFQFSATAGGASINTTGSQSGTHTLKLTESLIGDDFTFIGTINGGATLQVSKTMSTEVSWRGSITVNGTFDWGTLASPIPITYTALVEQNNSTTGMAAGRYTIATNSSTGIISFCGTARTVRTYVTNVVSPTQFDVADGTNWQNGDILAFGPTSATPDTVEARAITGVSSLGGTAYRITISAATTNTTSVGRDIMNQTNNVLYTSRLVNLFNGANPAGSGGNTNGGTVNMYNTTVMLGGIYTLHGSINNTTKCSLSNVTFTDVYKVSGSTVTNAKGGVGFLYLDNSTATNLNFISCLADFNTNPHYMVRGSGSTYNGINSLGAFCLFGPSFYDNTYNNIWAKGFGGLVGIGATVGTTIVKNSKFGAYFNITTNDALWTATSTTDFRVQDSDLNYGSIAPSTVNPYAFFSPATYPAFSFSNCTLPSSIDLPRDSTLALVAKTAYAQYLQKNGDITLNERWNATGYMKNNLSTYKHSLGSIQLDSWFSTSPVSFPSFTVKAAANETLTFLPSVQTNSSYDVGSTPPTITISAPNMTDVVHTATSATATPNTWFDTVMTATNPNSYAVDMTITFTAQSNADAKGASAFFDGLTVAPWVNVSRHYGYIYDNKTNSTVNPYITQTNEATVLAYTGISIDHGTQTITITSNHSVKEIYDYCYANLAQTANLAQAEFFTTADGTNYISTYNLVLNGGNITGTGTISLGSKTLTRAGSESSTLPITYNSGAAALVNISVTGLVANSRVYINNTTDSVSLYNAVVAATSLSTPVIWTANKALDVRVTYCVGTSAYLPFEINGTLTSSGAGFAITQLVDTVYNGNAIDGSIVTEYVTDFPNVQIDLSGAGTTTTPQRAYAWYVYELYTSSGIINYFGGLTATDSVNYRINANIMNLLFDNTSGHNIQMNGGYIYRSDGANWIYSLSANSIIPFYDRAYIANSSNLFADLAVVNTGVQKASKFIPHTANLPY